MKIDGIEFRNKTEYDAGLRDQEQITKIKQQYDLTQIENVRKVMQLISQNDYQFETALGRKFDDDLYELSVELSTNPKAQSPHDEHDERLEEEAIAILQRNEKRRKVSTVFFGIVALASLGYSFHYYSQYEMNSSQVGSLSSLKDTSVSSKTEIGYVPGVVTNTDTEQGELTILPEYQELYNLNKKLIGWLKIDDTVVDYPVMQTVNNEYYLTHGFEQNKDNNGSIFLDYRNDFVNRNTNLILYGHNMKSGKMFGTLSNYKKESYYRKHPKIEFDTIYEKGLYEIAFVFEGQVYTGGDIAFKYYEFFDAESKQEFDSNIQSMKELSFYDTGVTVSYGDELLTLSTCDSSADKRFVVVAKRVK